MKPISPFGLPIGISIAFWSIVGILRLIQEKIFLREKTTHRRTRYKPTDIAAIVPAHNEELAIQKCVQALARCIDKKQIYVISDGSADKTYERARAEGVHVSKLDPGRGKAKALVYGLEEYQLFKNYKLIFIVDADTRVDESFVKKALPIFDDPKVGVVFGSSRIVWPNHILPRLRYYFIAYRERLNLMLRYLLIYGQTWKYTSVNYVIPGFCTIYRSDVLSKLEIDTPGILIEDFNLAFQFHKKRAWRLGYKPSLIGWDQYPDNLVDYVKQIRRWNIGFFQTVRKNGIWPSFFWLTLGVFSAEVLLNSIFVLFLPLLALYLFSPWFLGLNPTIDAITNFYHQFGPYTYLSLGDIFVGAFLIDYVTTVIIGLTHKRPQMLFYGLFFFPMHVIVSAVLLSSIVPGFFGKSTGRWVPPTRSAEQLG